MEMVIGGGLCWANARFTASILNIKVNGMFIALVPVVEGPGSLR